MVGNDWKWLKRAKRSAEFELAPHIVPQGDRTGTRRAGYCRKNQLDRKRVLRRFHELYPAALDSPVFSESNKTKTTHKIEEKSRIRTNEGSEDESQPA